jgi:hypothetical protein
MGYEAMDAVFLCLKNKADMDNSMHRFETVNDYNVFNQHQTLIK